MKLRYGDIISIISIVGIAVTIYQYLDYYYLTQYCIDGCGAVLSSTYAYLLGIPIGIWTVSYFASSICLCKIFYSEKSLYMFMAITVAASLYAIFLTYVSIYILKMVCIYCLILNLLIQIETIATIVYIRYRRGPLSPPVSF